jgi:hypothetical protein
MKKIIIGSVLAISVIVFSGCSSKCGSKLPTCASACTPAPAPCGCPK